MITPWLNSIIAAILIASSILIALIVIHIAIQIYHDVHVSKTTDKKGRNENASNRLSRQERQKKGYI